MSFDERGKVWGAFFMADKAGKLSGEGKVKNTEIAALVVKKNGQHPTPQAISQIRQEYLRNKRNGGNAGAMPKAKPKARPKRKAHNAIPVSQKKKVAEVAMRIKRRGGEPSASAVIIAAPKATTNAKTGDPMSQKTITKIFKEYCFDDEENKQDTWDHRQGLTRTSLSEAQIGKRLFWATNLKNGPNLNANWFFRNVIWFDPCYTILPGTKGKLEMCMRNNGRGKRWCS